MIAMSLVILPISLILFLKPAFWSAVKLILIITLRPVLAKLHASELSLFYLRTTNFFAMINVLSSTIRSPLRENIIVKAATFLVNNVRVLLKVTV